MPPRRAIAFLAFAALLAAAPAWAIPATVYCVNNKIFIERSTMSQMQSGRGHSEICIIGPSFDFQPDGRTWVQKNLNSDQGGACRCR